MDGKNRLTCMIFGRKIPCGNTNFHRGLFYGNHKQQLFRNGKNQQNSAENCTSGHARPADLGAL